MSFLVLIPSFDSYIISITFDLDKKFKTIACINQELLDCTYKCTYTGNSIGTFF